MVNISKEEYIKNTIVTFKKDTIRKKGQNIPNNLETTYNQLKEEKIRYRNLAKKLGLTYSEEKMEDMDIHSSINQIKNNIQGIIDQIQKVDDLVKLNKIKGEFSKLEDLAQDGTITSEYTEMLKETFTKSFDTKVQNLIKNSKLLKLEKERDKIQKEKISIIGRIFGKEKLKQVQLDNIDIRKQLLNFEEEKDKLEYSLEDSLSELYAYSQCELDGKLTDEMQDFLKAVKSDVQLKKMINEQNFTQQIEQKVSERQAKRQLVPIENTKLNNRQQASILQSQNNDMNRQLQNNRIKNLTKQNFHDSGTINNRPALSRFYSIVNEIKQSTRIKDREQQRNKQKLQIEL